MSFFICVFSIWANFHKQSRSSGQQQKGEVISLIPLYRVKDTQTLAERLLRANLCPWLTAGPFDF